ncbi:MAG: deoxyribodipyrimidine photo-lyase [Rhodoferax sp.]
MGVQVVWFKRDLRVHDHAPLAQAVRAGPVLCLAVIEPSLWSQSDASTRQYGFYVECLRDLAQALQDLGLRLQVRHGEVVDVLAELHATHPLAALHSHQETGNGVSFARDRAVARWCRDHGVPWHQTPAFGVVRGLKDRALWHPAWEAHMRQPQAPVPDAHACRAAPSPWADGYAPAPSRLGLAADPAPQRQTGGRSQGLAVFQDFLNQRCQRYRGGISSPLRAPTACSRLSAHLAWGTLSLREVVQATRQQILCFQERLPQSAQGLEAFLSRLHWHCHFIQKLESEPELEWRNLHRGYDGLRESDFNPGHFAALTQGRTGWPLVDACVAMLRETGWINFRMRAMLVSVASYPLWLHWREVGLWLARQFVDYEPGIHWSQMQMQAGTTGINTTRIYNPVKQALDHDPQGHFVRRWCPALRRVPDAWLFEPWRMPPSVQRACGVRVAAGAAAGLDDVWPLPPVDLASATRAAKQALYARRNQPEVRAAKAAIVEKHAARAAVTARARRPRAARAAAVPTQASLFDTATPPAC